MLMVCSLVLASAAEMVVPARGKALVPTDLSIAIPHGTYARVGEQQSLSSFFRVVPRVFDEMFVPSDD